MSTQPAFFGETIHLRGPPRGFGEQGNKGIFFRGTGGQWPKIKGEQGNTGNFGEQGTYRNIKTSWPQLLINMIRILDSVVYTKKMNLYLLKVGIL